ncbi:hypothetical protein [Paenibacillus roseipurpureus]|uniref:Cohesin domain-containing protein n=1 Tax=Paenibacillus roseopurpureus TaxID=2918901 RepID=A0AA96LKT5_9BACL|nr:hypothetical protein [Paenibacillus sp. MBLB1832]WNR42916.1 hypothetical protein MJB10_17555 [Paenibacillus sp. MBLB1832]
MITFGVKRSMVWLSFSILTVLSLAGSVPSASAEANTVSLPVQTHSQQFVEVKIKGEQVSGLYAVQFHLDYDPDVLQLMATSGQNQAIVPQYFDHDSNGLIEGTSTEWQNAQGNVTGFQSYRETVPGQLDYVATQVGVGEAVEAEADLVKLTFLVRDPSLLTLTQLVYSEGNYWGEVGGQLGPINPNIQLIQHLPPVTTDDAPQGWVNEDVTIHLQPTGRGSAVASTFYIMDGGEPLTGTEVAVSGEGTHLIHYWSVDESGLREQVKSATVKIDKAAPITTAVVAPAAADGTNGWYRTKPVVTLNVYDAFSGAVQTELQLNNGEWSTVTAPLELGDGKQTIGYRSKDAAGNVGSTETINVNVDTIAPDTNISLSPDGVYWIDQDMVINVSVMDAGSGIDVTKTSVLLDGRPVQQGETIAVYKLPLGQHTLIVSATDLAGHTQSKSSTFETKVNLESLKALLKRLIRERLITNEGVANSLSDKLARGQLKSFVDEIRTRKGNQISEDLANLLLRQMDNLRD